MGICQSSGRSKPKKQSRFEKKTSSLADPYKSIKRKQSEIFIEPVGLSKNSSLKSKKKSDAEIEFENAAMDSEFMTKSMLNLYNQLGADTTSDIMIYNHESDSKLDSALLESPNLENKEEKIHENQKDFIIKSKEEEEEEAETIVLANDEDLEEDVFSEKEEEDVFSEKEEEEEEDSDISLSSLSETHLTEIQRNQIKNLPVEEPILVKMIKRRNTLSKQSTLDLTEAMLKAGLTRDDSHLYVFDN